MEENKPELEQQEPQWQEPHTPRHEAFAFIWETIKVVVISVAVIIPIRYFLVQPFFVKGASMEPTFQDGNYILIDEISYDLRKPERGEIIVFRFPEDPSQFFIKRVIALPNETVEIKNNTITVFNEEHPNGFTLEEDYLENGQITTGNIKLKIAPDDYFVLGDNRLRSSDSRSWGTVTRNLITGRVFFRALPLNEFGKFKTPEY